MISPATAMQRWCPFSRAHYRPENDDQYSAAVSANRSESGKPLGACHCLAGGCMAWRWIDPEYPSRGGYCGLVPQPTE